MIKSFPIQNLQQLGALLVVLAWVCWLLGGRTSYPTLSSIENIISDTIFCQTGSSHSQDIFVVFVPNKALANSLIDIICQNSVLSRQYGKVEVRWSINEQAIIQHVGKGIADLALVKENLMQAFATSSTHSYTVIGSYQDYAAYLISLREKPEISKQYLWGKRFGILDYPSSRSGHIIPKRMLNSLGLNEENLQIVYASSHNELRELLLSGKVDLISSYWKDEDSQYFSENYITQLQNQVSGSRWYLKMQTQNTDLLCEMQHTLALLAEQTPSTYLSQLIFAPLCQEKSGA